MRAVVKLFVIYHLLNGEFIICQQNEASSKYSEEFEKYKVVKIQRIHMYVRMMKMMNIVTDT